MTAVPHERPAPKPLITTCWPRSSRPSARASSRAIGIEPADVLPYFSRLVNTRERGMCSTSIAALMMRMFAWCGMYRSISSALSSLARRTSLIVSQRMLTAQRKTARPSMIM